MTRLIRKAISGLLAWRSRRALARSVPGWREADEAEREARARHGRTSDPMKRKQMLLHAALRMQANETESA